MADIIDYITGPWSRIWMALESHSKWANIIKLNNRIKYAPGEATTAKKTFVDSASFPRAMLIPVDIVDDMFIGSETFATQDEDFDPNQSEWLETINVNYMLTINSRDIELGRIDMIGIYTLQALRRLGPKMKLPYVSTIGKISITCKEASRSKSTYRWDFFIKIPVVIQIEGNQITA